jgi:hypothetical protein
MRRLHTLNLETPKRLCPQNVKYTRWRHHKPSNRERHCQFHRSRRGVHTRTLSVDGASTFNGDISAEKMTIQHNTVQNMDVVQNTSLSGTVDFNMTDLTLPSVYCKSKLDVQEEISTTKLSGSGARKRTKTPTTLSR